MDAGPSSSASSASVPTPDIRLSELVEQLHTSFISLPEELCAASRPSSPSSEARTGAWKNQIAHALEVAGGDTTHPKWGYVSRITQLACTRRGYVGVAAGVRVGDGRKVNVGEGFQWVLPETEKEWKHCEKRWEQVAEAQKRSKSKPSSRATRTSKYWSKPGEEQPDASSSRSVPFLAKATLIREKVERWQAQVAPESVVDAPASQKTVDLSQSPAADKGRAKAIETYPSGEKVQASLGFRVVKRSSVTDAKGGRSAPSRPKVTSPAHPRTPPSQDISSDHPAPVPTPSNPAGRQDVPEGSRIQNLPQIAEVPELSFLPPSFPSQLQTSTPPLNVRRQKPAPIAPCSPPLSSPQSLISSKSFNPSRPRRREPPPASSSAPASAASPARKTLKRARTPNLSADDHMDVSLVSPPSKAPPPKKARVDPPSDQAPISSGPQPVPPSTPPLVTSPPNGPVTPVSKGKGLGNARGLPVPTTPDPHPVPTLTELLASSRRSKPRPRPPSRKKTPQSNLAANTKSLREQAETETALPALEDDETEPSPTKTYFSSPASGSSDSASVVHRSPVSPLFTQNPGAFVPAFVSSQRPSANDDDPFVGTRGQSQSQGLMRGSSGYLGMGYNSQFDVEGQVDRVSELLERDVDYNGWLRDLDDEEEMPHTQSQGALGVGY